MDVTFGIKPSGAALGAEIHGLDLAQPLDGQRAALEPLPIQPAIPDEQATEPPLLPHPPACLLLLRKQHLEAGQQGKQQPSLRHTRPVGVVDPLEAAGRTDQQQGRGLLQRLQAATQHLKQK